MSNSGLVVDSLTHDFHRHSVGPVTFSLEPGRCLGLVGANGAGKTTVLRMMLGLIRASSGSTTWGGTTVRYGHPTPGVSGMIEEPQFYPWLDARANIAESFPSRRLDAARVDDVLTEVGLGDVGKRRVAAYSQGMRQRLGIARVLLAEPSLVVLDEPTNGLDPLGIRWLRDLLERLRATDVTVVLSSHMLAEVQLIATDYVMISDGKTIRSGSMANLDGSLEEEYIRALS